MIGTVQPRKSLIAKLLLVVLSGAAVIAGIASWGHQGARPNSQSGLSHPRFNASQVVIGFQWLADEIAYPPPGPGEDTNAIGPVAPYFDKVGYQIHGDTFPMTWANDDEIYTSAGDPGWGGKNEGLDVERFFGMPPLRKAVTEKGGDRQDVPHEPASEDILGSAWAALIIFFSPRVASLLRPPRPPPWPL